MKLSDIPSQGPFTPRQLKFLRARQVMADRVTLICDAAFTRELDEIEALDDMATNLAEGKAVLIRKKGPDKVTISFSDKP